MRLGDSGERVRDPLMLSVRETDTVPDELMVTDGAERLCASEGEVDSVDDAEAVGDEVTSRVREGCVVERVSKRTVAVGD